MRYIIRATAFLLAIGIIFLYGKKLHAETIGDVILQEGNAVIEQSGEDNISVQGLDIF